jgi:hypothetical protein
MTVHPLYPTFTKRFGASVLKRQCNRTLRPCLHRAVDFMVAKTNKVPSAKLWATRYYVHHVSCFTITVIVHGHLAPESACIDGGSCAAAPLSWFKNIPTLISTAARVLLNLATT